VDERIGDPLVEGPSKTSTLTPASPNPVALDPEKVGVPVIAAGTASRLIVGATESKNETATLGPSVVSTVARRDEVGSTAAPSAEVFVVRRFDAATTIAGTTPRDGGAVQVMVHNVANQAGVSSFRRRCSATARAPNRR
jgi:hypothetical protein